MRKIVSFLTMLMLCSILALAQSRPITGRVTDENGQPVSGASVTIRGTTTGTAADANGNFTINAKTGDVLIITALNLPNKEVTVGNGSSVSVTMTRQSQALSEVVVTTALGVQRQAKTLGYSATTITNKDLVQGKSVNVQQALNGKISGLNISTVNSGVFENAKINIRGIRSLTGNNSPMLVVDGAPTPLGYLSSIPPNDVASLTVLKSAASAAIYGPDAVNGVIVITTKRGGRKPTISLTSTVQVTRVSFFPKLQDRFGAGAGETTDPYGNYDYIPYENQQYGPAFDGSIKPVGKPLEDGSQLSLPYTNAHFKDKKKFFNSGLTFQNSASIAGEDFYVGVDDAKIKGLIPDDENRRTSIRLNAGRKFGKFGINFGLNYVTSKYDVVNEAGFQNTFPDAYNGGLFFLVMQTPSNVPLLDYKDWRNNKWAQFSNYFNEFAVNPYWLIGNIRQKGRTDDVIGNVDLNLQILPWMKATARVSTNLTFNNSKATNAPVVVSDFAASTRSGTTYSNRPGSVIDQQGFNSRVNLDYFLSGDKDFKKDFNVRYILGGTIRNNRSKDVTVGGNNLVLPLYNVSVKSGEPNVPTYPNANYEITSRLLSAFGTVGFTYKGWASIEFTGRNDWDSRLLKENRSFFYPAANVALVLSDAVDYLKNSRTFSYVKLRAAISKSGNVNLAPYQLSATYQQPVGFPYGTTAGFTANNVKPSADLKPEFVNTKEVGLDLGFMRNRLNVSATYFYQKNTNQILQISRSWTTGYPAAIANAADFKNYGIEMEASLSPVINLGRKGRLDFRANATYNNNQVLNTLGGNKIVIGGSNGFIQNSVSSPIVNNIAVPGMAAFAFQMTDYLRDPQGHVIVDPISGLPSQSPELVIKGRTLPTWIIGATPTITFGNLSFAMTWDYKGGHNFFSGLGADADFAGISARSAEYNRQRFVFPNSVYYNGTKYVNNNSVMVQDGNYSFWSTATNTGIATNYYASAAAWRLRELNISYSLPNRWLNKFGNNVIKSVTISAVGKNLFLFVPKSNQWGDPEFNYSSTGNTFGVASSFQAPASRLLGGSLNVVF